VDAASSSTAIKRKRTLLGVPEAAQREYGAVSEEVARAMAEGAMERSGVELAFPAPELRVRGGTAEKPVGLVHIAARAKGQRRCIWNAVSAISAARPSSEERRRSLKLGLQIL
jgi:nicotinamide-nucleotide amidase